MKRVRIGNDVNIHWSIFATHGKDVTPYDLTGKNLKLYVSTMYGKEEHTDFETDGNVVIFKFSGKDQKYTGRYQLTLVENDGLADMHTVDECDAFELVNCLCMEDEVNDDEAVIGGDDVELSSELKLIRVSPIIPVIGENGNWVVNGKDTGMPSRGEAGSAVELAYVYMNVNENMELQFDFLPSESGESFGFEMTEEGYLNLI